MKKVVVPFGSWTAVVCVVVAGLWLSDASVAGVITFGSVGNQFNMEFVTIGNAGNADDTTGVPNVAGKVDYAYQMGKFEVSEDMITKYNANFGTANGLAITKDIRGADKPATSVSWNEAARFVNWLNTSTGGFAAYKFTTSGVNDYKEVWTAADTDDYDASNPYRSKRTKYVLPSMDEWYKAAYYDPNTATYFAYATGSNTAPTAVASGTAANTAVYDYASQNPADVTSAGGLSPYGIMGLSGNVYEWEETAHSLNNNSGFTQMAVRGGSWQASSANISRSFRIDQAGTSEFVALGFRVASLSSGGATAAVPEPSSLILFGTVAISALWYRKRLRK